MEILKNIDLQKYNTFAVPSIAQEFVVIRNIEDIRQLINMWIFENHKFYVLGMWANTVFVWDFDWLIIKDEISGKEIIEQNDDEILIRVGAGECWYEFVSQMAQDGFVWMENLAYIPSSIWSTAVQNIWAYGSEAKDVIEQVEWIWLDTWEQKVFKNSECEFGYRESIFKNKLCNKFIITSVVYRLKKYKKWYQFNTEYAGISQKIEELGLDINSLTPSDFVDVITQIRQWKLPDWKEIGTAWSFFKNPVISATDWQDLQQNYPELKWFEVNNWIKLSAWQLIDMCGFKWKWNWKVWTYKSHALILVNEWWASGQDVLDFSSQIQNAVQQKFGVFLEPEAIFK